LPSDLATGEPSLAIKYPVTATSCQTPGRPASVTRPRTPSPAWSRARCTPGYTDAVITNCGKLW